MTNEEIFDKWTRAAWDMPETPSTLPVPYSVLAGEALDVLRFAQRNWEPAFSETGQPIHPGLSTAVGNGMFKEDAREELHQLYEVAQAQQERYKLASRMRRPAPMEEAHFVLAEIRATLDWYFDDGQLTDEDAQLEGLAQAHDGARSQDDVAAALLEYAALAEAHVESLDGLGGFETTRIEEARTLARALRERSAGPAGYEAPGEREALELRNRLAALLYGHMQRIRAAARFVFRNRPELVRQVGSSYLRRQRADHRRRKTEQEVAAPETTTSTGEEVNEAATM